MYKIYQVEYGDTIETIANKANTTVEEVMMINGLKDDSDLVVGSLIVVPKKANDFFITYVVKQGDSIYSIARMYDVDPDTILLLNGLKKEDYIYPNQELVIPNSDVVVYVTKDGDTIDLITNNLGIDANTLSEENDRIYVLEDQLIVHKKEKNR